MTSVSVKASADRSVDTDHNEADCQLQRSLALTCRSPDPNGISYSSRKHGWNASRTSLESDFLSEVSGQFDDAEEPNSPLPDPVRITTAMDADYSPSSSHSVKRRRSNDWSQQPGDSDSTAWREHASNPRQRWPFHHYGKHSSSVHSSPRSSRHARPGRRSRFVEGHMNDSVSEKPPSIFLRDGAQNETARGSSRQSGIFRFGKAIASAFNPFAGWGSVTEIWKGSQDGCHPPEATNDRLRQAERAYEELKRSGYQGTVKGSYMQSLGAADANLPGETWRLIQEKMDDKSGLAYHSRQSSGQAPSHNGSVSGSSLRASFPDLRKAKSSLGFPSIKRTDGMSSMLQHLDGRDQEVRHQKSRKDMLRQAKLLKRVSDLEDKLERARRELRELVGEEELLMGSLQEEKPYQRTFVPGALPSLPSERLLHGPKPTTLSSPLAEGVLQGTENLTQIHVNKTRLKSPKSWRKPSQSEPRSRSAHSPSRKRKSPDPPESRKLDRADDQQRASNPDIQGDPAPVESKPEPEPEAEAEATMTPSRKAKFPKTARGDSPGSVERKQQKKTRSPAGGNTSSPAEERVSRPLRSTNPRNRSATPVLRMKRGRVDLRSTSSPADIRSQYGPDENKENRQQQENDNDKNHGANKLDQNQLQQQNDGSDQTTPSTPSSGRRKARYEYIPPVPPLPKDLAATAAKVDRRLAREMGKRRVQRENNGTGAGEGFQWPEDIF